MVALIINSANPRIILINNDKHPIVALQIL
jgi:hypothetical protein